MNTNTSTTPDGLADWQKRRHGADHPNTPRPLTSARVVQNADGSYDIHGDNGTTRLNVGGPLLTASRDLLAGVTDPYGSSARQAPVLSDTPEPTSDHEVIPAGSLITVSIGRNVGSAPMSNSSWDLFAYNVSRMLRGFSADVYGPFYGEGQWDGVVEECATFTAVTKYPVTVTTLEKLLEKQANYYRQDAIAWSYGPARLARGQK